MGNSTTNKAPNMAKALEAGFMLYPNPENATKPIVGPKSDGLKNRKKYDKEGTPLGSIVQVMERGESNDCVFSRDSGMLMLTCPISIPVSWLIELEGPVAYLRRLAGHRRRVRKENEKARQDRSLSLAARNAAPDRTSGYIQHSKPSATDIVVPGSVGVPALLWEDVILVGCHKCGAKLLGSTMQRVVSYLWDDKNLRDGSTVPKKLLRATIPKKCAVTVAIGESYCHGCVPGTNKRSDLQ